MSVVDHIPADMEAADADADAEEEAEAERVRSEQEKEIDIIIDEKVRELEQLDLEQQLEPRPLSANDKINEWMKSSEFEQQPHEPSPPAVDGQNDAVDAVVEESQLEITDEDKTLNELLEQVAELDEIYTDYKIQRDTYRNTIQNELDSLDKRPPLQVEESFDDAATYTSLQIAFKNPVIIPMDDIMPPTPPMSQCAPEDAQHYDPVEINSQKVNENLLNSTRSEGEKVPPLPPKRLRKQDSNAENRSIEANGNDEVIVPPPREKSRLPPPVIHPRLSELTAPTKRLPPAPSATKEKNPNFNTLPRQKKPGFFSKIFNRRKSKPDLSQNSKSCVQLDAPGTEASVRSFNSQDPLRSSVRSTKSSGAQALQQSNKSLNTSPVKSGKKPGSVKTGKPVGRSVSSVSGKRPGYLNADVVHIPLKGDSANSLPHHQPNEAYSNSSTITLGGNLDRRTASALQLADIPISEGGMELVAIADRQSLHNLVNSIEAHFNVKLDPNLDLTEAEHFALYTSVPPQATASEFDENSAYYAPVDAGEILTPDEVAKRLAAANKIN
ncbi:embryonic polarity protein dorsal-like [Drosophila willistoni]|uniref:embryonic polarity protein dorsal-like n=1 Tax=Drosophila willistoni TaxID=7260 RepID=UPI001F08174B|nr:embryonic polarity protein dorsal-like [Drosophila willistoni]